MKTIKFLLTICPLLMALVSCNKDENNAADGNAKISAKVLYSSTGKSSGRLSNTVVLNSFKINLKEIEFEFDGENDDDSNDDGFYDGDEDFKLNGPFELNLLNAPATITLVDLPNGRYEEVEFKMDKNENASSPMFNKSVEIKGTINGTPFVYWDDEDEEFEVDYDDQSKDITVSNNSVDVVFEFDLNSLLASIDFSSAKDGDGDGVIEIGPNDQDGNSSLADQIDDKLEEFTDLDD
jgi:hypothetical protein